ncbi:glucosaminidase domain-containing protein [Alphaproteobacteria bacterium]|nr:glucosaminidase domain-containing protein [Alphaproteobacteria bacterium]
MKYDPLKSSLLIFFFGFLLNSSLNAGEFHNWVDLNKYYKKNNFIPEILTQENIGHLPIISELPDDFSEIQDVPTKKKLFYLVTLPLIYNANASIMQERRMVINIEKKFARKDLNKNETDEIIRLSKKYKLDYSEINTKLFRKLKQRINIIPVSLALGQAIIESGWGQSRFATEGNALYGQWTTSEDKGIIPQDRDEDKTHAVLKFKDLSESVIAYMFNINTHQAYYNFRVIRRIDERIKYTDPISMKVKYLAAYAEIGDKYVDKLELIIASNNLQEFDRFKFN